MSNTLSKSNPYLRDPKAREEGLWISAKTSSAIEGIHKPFATRDAKSGRLIETTKRPGSYSAAKSGRSNTD